MNRLGFPLLISSGLVLGVFLAPKMERAPTGDTPEATPHILINRDATHLDPDATAQVMESFLVDAQGTERQFVTRVSLARGEHEGELPWRVRGELARSQELLGWAGRVPVETDQIAWGDAVLSARWQDMDGRAVVLGVVPREGESSAELAARYSSNLEGLRGVVRPASWDAQELSALEASASQWLDNDGIEHRISASESGTGAAEEDLGDGAMTGDALLQAELRARYPSATPAEGPDEDPAPKQVD